MFKYIILLGILIAMPVFAQDDSNAPPLPPGIGSYEDLVALYDYDTEAPLEIQEIGIEMREEIAIHDLTFVGSPERTTEAYLVLPLGEGPFPAVLWIHWFSPRNDNSNRTEFLDEAVTLADHGVASLLVSTLWSTAGRFWTRDAQENIETSISQVIDLRRGLDLLTAREDIDSEKIAVVGHDFGGMYGTLLAGIDSRVKSLVVMAAAPYFADWFNYNVGYSGEALEQFYADMAVIDPIYYVGYLEPENVLLQFAIADGYVLNEKVEVWAVAVDEAVYIGRYDGFHELDEVAREERDAFLMEQFGVAE